MPPARVSAGSRMWYMLEQVGPSIPPPLSPPSRRRCTWLWLERGWVTVQPLTASCSAAGRRLPSLHPLSPTLALPNLPQRALPVQEKSADHSGDDLMEEEGKGGDSDFAPEEAAEDDPQQVGLRLPAPLFASCGRARRGGLLCNGHHVVQRCKVHDTGVTEALTRHVAF
jgi:hypothetical protein